MRQCDISGCNKRHYARGWCAVHYQRWRHHGDPSIRLIDSYKGVSCLVEDCERAVAGKGYCNAHYQKWIKYGDPLVCFNKDGYRRDLFWQKVAITANPDKCWEWVACRNRLSYGMVTFGGKGRSAHRVAWFLVYGQWPKQELLHSCDNRGCVNPAHLREGTHKENMREAKERNRLAIGERAGTAVLKERNIPIIRRLLTSGVSKSAIARQFAVSHSTIRSIARGDTWGHVL